MGDLDAKYTLRIVISLEMVAEMSVITTHNTVKEQVAATIPVPEEIVNGGDPMFTDKWLEAQMERAVIRYQTNKAKGEHE